MYITPVEASTSVIITVEVPPFSSVKITFPSFNEAVILFPCTVFMTNFPSLSFIALITSAAKNLPNTKW